MPRDPKTWCRESDRTPWGRVKVRAARTTYFVQRHFDRIVSLFMIGSAIGFGVMGMVIWTTREATTNATRELCERAQRFGPLNEREHRKLGVYNTQDLRDFKRTIPQNCP